MTDAPAQRFSFGYHLITWDLAGESLNDALAFLAENGIQWFESLLGDSLGTDFARRRMSLGPVRLNPVVRDTDIFTRLGLTFTQEAGVFKVTPSSYRFDIEIEEDLIEEVARVYGFDNIPALPPVAPNEMKR